MRIFPTVLALALACFFAPKAFAFDLKPVPYSALPQWQNSTETTLKHKSLGAFVRSCEKIKNLPDMSTVGKYAGTAKHWKPICIKARGASKRVAESTSPAEKDMMARQFFESNFTAYLVTDNGKEQGLFTGYYIPELEVSWKKTGEYIHPVYAVPKDYVQGEKYLTRKQINAGALKGRAIPLAYAKDPVKLFFMQVQGSGRVKFTDGRASFFAFAAKNNQPYTAIGKVLIQRGEIKAEEVSAPAIMAWLRAHPDQAQEVMEQNASYVFFREAKDEAVTGAQGVQLMPFISLAVDNDYIAYGAPLWLNTTLPGKDGRLPYSALMIAQDTGTAIKGAIRGDIFFGHGKEAERLAGHMNSKGSYYILLPRGLKITHEKR